MQYILSEKSNVFYTESNGNHPVYRTQEGIEEKESWANEYLSSFKVNISLYIDEGEALGVKLNYFLTPLSSIYQSEFMHVPHHIWVVLGHPFKEVKDILFNSFLWPLSLMITKIP